MPLPHQSPLQEHLYQLLAISHSIPLLESQGFQYKTPIIDAAGSQTQPNGNPNTIMGLRNFKDAVSREIEVVEQYLSRPDHKCLPEISTNASYFIAVWNEILSAPPPIIAIGKIVEPPLSSRDSADIKRKTITGAREGCAKPRGGGVKIDVVADEGRKWIRVNTMKNSRILAEFREIDSYLTSSEDDSDSGDELFSAPHASDQENSLLRMGRALTKARTAPIPGTHERPSVTLRLTRLQPDPPDGDTLTDPRIAQTIDALKSMGLDVQLGEREFWSLQHDPENNRKGEGTTPVPSTSTCRSRSPVSVQLFRPTSRINMDLSILIALVSDLSHAQLPHNEEGAWARFQMPVNARGWKLGKSGAEGTPCCESAASKENVEYSKHSRALSMQCLQEMERGLVDELVERLKDGRDDSDVEFWATEEARDRCLQIVDKIGGKDEKRRAHALFPQSSHSLMEISRCREEFWLGSRFPPSYLPFLIPIRIHPSPPYTVAPPLAVPHPYSTSSLFWGHLIQTCRYILSHDAAPHPRLYRKNGEMERAKVTKLNTKLTMHTVESMLVGACGGMTTLTANKASVKALLREMRGVIHGGENVADVGTCAEERGGRGLEGEVAAAIWIVEPRSLAEGMRADLLTPFNAT